MPIHVERSVVVRVTHDEVVGARVVRRFVAGLLVRRELPARLFGRLFVGPRFQQRVLRQLFGDERLELEVAELKQLYCLLQLRREDQLLRLADT